MPNVQQAAATVKRVAPDLSASGVALVVAIAGLEAGSGGPGTGFEPYHNWGAITAGSSWTGATFAHGDSKWTPEGIVHYVTNFRAYPDDDSAALGLVQLLRSQYKDALAAANDGNWLGASRALYDHRYYTGVKPRLAAIADHYKALSKWLVAQGIHPALVGAAIGLEAIFWIALGVFGLRAAKRATR
jgi:flagellum-specific peptidoglycan hydrolase FlgJ